jgi:hypothetical protein
LDYGLLGAGDFNALSIGNDPGVLLADEATPNIGYVSIDVRAAMQDDIYYGRAFSAFMIRMATDTDNDNGMDEWYFRTSERTGTSEDPYIEYTSTAPTPTPTPRPVGGIVMPTNKLEILTPYLAVAGLVAIVSAVVLVKRRKD